MANTAPWRGEYLCPLTLSYDNNNAISDKFDTVAFKI